MYAESAAELNHYIIGVFKKKKKECIIYEQGSPAISMRRLSITLTRL